MGKEIIRFRQVMDDDSKLSFAAAFMWGLGIAALICAEIFDTKRYRGHEINVHTNECELAMFKNHDVVLKGICKD